nr:DUF4367 domain-containing protein [Bacillota bacterium]
GKVKRHLEVCASCRSEYHSLENADNALRQVICEMVADIEVPRCLSERIVEILPQRKSNTLRSRLSILLKTPAVAAALLFMVLAAGFGAYNNYFNPAYLQKVAISEKDDGKFTGSAAPPAVDSTGASVRENEGRLNETQITQTDTTGNPDVQMRKDQDNTVRAPEITLKGPAQEQTGDASGISRGQQPSAPAGETAPEGLNESQPAEEQKTAFTTFADPGMSGSMNDANDGTLEAAPRHVDFMTAKPDYLPPGSILVNITRLAGEITQEYRTGANYFTVSQIRLMADDSAFIKKPAQVANININGCQGFIEESRPEPGDHVSAAITTLRWRQGDWAFSVSGDLPAEEIIKISESVK